MTSLASVETSWPKSSECNRSDGGAARLALGVRSAIVSSGEMSTRFFRLRQIADQLPESAYPLWGIGQSLSSFIFGPRHPIRASELIRPFFIIGSGRSGNTLLRRVLQAHSELHIPPENQALGAAITLYRRNRALPWPHLVDLVLGTFQFSHGFEAFGVDLRPLAEQLHDAPKRERNLAHLLDELYRFHATAQHKRCLYWGDKTPLNTFNAFKIASVFPGARFIHMLRDGVDVVESYVRSGLISSYEEAARRWLASVDAARLVGRRYPSRFIEVRYEDLVREPDEAVREVCAFLDVEFEPDMISRTEHAKSMGDVLQYDHHAKSLTPISASSVGTGRRVLDSKTLKMLAPVIGAQLRDLGYESIAS